MFLYVDYIQIHTITIHNDLLCMDGAYHDPISAKMKFTYFEAEFDYFYKFLTDNNFENTDFALEALSATLTDKKPSWINLHDKFIELHTRVFRLTTLVDEHDDKKEVGFLINDGYLLEDGCLSFQQHFVPPTFEGNDRARKVKLLRTYRNMSGHLAALALRYAYYNCLLREKIHLVDALALSSLQDDLVFSASKSAFNYLSLEPDVAVQNTDDIEK